MQTDCTYARKMKENILLAYLYQNWKKKNI